MLKRMRRRQWSGARRSRSCPKQVMVVRRKRLLHKKKVRRVGARPELVPSVLCTDAPARLEDVVASMNRAFLLVFFSVVFSEGTWSAVGYRVAWPAGVQALRSVTERRSGPSQATWAGGSAGWWGGGPQTRWKAAGSGAMRSCRRLVAGDRRGRNEQA
jgi:hypothetical protein